MKEGIRFITLSIFLIIFVRNSLDKLIDEELSRRKSITGNLESKVSLNFYKNFREDLYMFYVLIERSFETDFQYLTVKRLNTKTLVCINTIEFT